MIGDDRQYGERAQPVERRDAPRTLRGGLRGGGDFDGAHDPIMPCGPAVRTPGRRLTVDERVARSLVGRTVHATPVPPTVKPAPRRLPDTSPHSSPHGPVPRILRPSYCTHPQ